MGPIKIGQERSNNFTKSLRPVTDRKIFVFVAPPWGVNSESDAPGAWALSKFVNFAEFQELNRCQMYNHDPIYIFKISKFQHIYPLLQICVICVAKYPTMILPNEKIQNLSNIWQQGTIWGKVRSSCILKQIVRMSIKFRVCWLLFKSQILHLKYLTSSFQSTISIIVPLSATY